MPPTLPDSTYAWVIPLLDWFAPNRRDLPWRRTYTPYHVWISEIMLQQTQMERGVTYFERWIRRFPDVVSLAAASEDEVFKHWEGLGYYSRARNLHRAAVMVRDTHAGELPRTVDGLQELPGIGPYTARAIASIALEQDVCLVDANVERLLSRLYDIALPVKTRPAQQQIAALCDAALPSGQARDFNQALMEFGSLVCSPRTPSCSSCPLATWCSAKAAGVQLERPVTAPKPEIIHLTMATGVLIRDGRILTQKRQADDIWANLWEFPGGLVESGETPEQAVVREFMEETALTVGNPRHIGIFRHAHTRYRVAMHAFHVNLLSDPAQLTLTAAQEYRWARWSEIRTLAFPAGHRKLIEHLAADLSFQALLCS